MKVLITKRLPDDIVHRIVEHHEVTMEKNDQPLEKAHLKAAIADKHGVLCLITDTLDHNIISHASKLRIIANFGVGFNNIDVAAATRRGILVTNTPDVLTDATADLAFALVLAVGRRIVEGDRIVREKRFHFWSAFNFLGSEVSGKTLGIIGMGRIGRAVACRARGFSMRVIYHNRHRLSIEQEKKLGARYLELNGVLEQADYLSLHVPLTPQTYHLIGADQMLRMKPGAFLINTSRGSVVDEPALLAALQSGRIAGAGLDVYENEPEVTPGLMDLNQVVLLPHVGSATVETRHNMAALAADNLLAGLAGRMPPNCLNPQVLKTGKRHE
jgi:glyoxylate reductase